MFILDTKESIKRNWYTYLGVTVFCMIFSTVYNQYGHGVESFYMNYLFLWPCIGSIWYMVLLALKKEANRLSNNLVGCGVATVTAGSLLRGIFEIAGTSSSYVVGFFVIGWICFGLGVFVYLFSDKLVKNK